MTDLVFFQAVFKDILDNKTASFTQSNLMPHTAESIIDILHDLGRSLSPPQLEQFLPDVAGVSVDDCLGYASKQFGDHDSLIVLRDRVKGFLYHVAPKRVHRQVQCVTTDGLCDLNHLLGSSMLEAALDEEVAEAVDHQWIGLGDDGLYNLILLLRCSNL